MNPFSAPVMNLLVALAAGLLIGAERERRKLERAAPSAAGIRTFALSSLAGAVGLTVGGAPLLAVAAGAVAVLTALGYWRTRSDQDPGLTTELALVLTTLVGGLAAKDPAAAAAVAVAVTVLLAGRERLHHFIGSMLTEEEFRAALILAAAAIVVLPLVPDQPMGPFAALNPRKIWRLVVIVLAIGAAGHAAVRALGPRFGLPITGLASGFVSSSATIGAMGARAAQAPGIIGVATAGAVLSTVATVVQMAVVVGATSPATLRALALPLIGAGLVAVAYGTLFTVRALRRPPEGGDVAGNAFSLAAALIFALLLGAVLLGSAALREWFGQSGAIAAAGLAGFVDTHAPAISIASLVAEAKMTPEDAVIPILVGFSTNTITKVVVACAAGSRRFAARLVPGLVLVAAAAWLGVLASEALR